MIYYHFGTKASLYQAVLEQLFSALLERVERLSQQEPDPLRRLVTFYAGIVGLFAERPELPRIMMREILTGGRHMDAAGQALSAIVAFVGAAVEQGVRKGEFRRVNPLLVHLGMMGPIIVFCVGEQFRKRVIPVAAPGIEPPTAEALLDHLTQQLTRSLAVDGHDEGGS